MSKKKKEKEVMEDPSVKNPLFGLPSLEFKNAKQVALGKAIKRNSVVIATGPAGTGKTHVALLQALHLLKDNPDLYDQVILSKSVVTVAEEELGFLPGDVREKMAPFMFSFTFLIDKIFRQQDRAIKLMDKHIVNWLPLAFIRGVNIERAIIIVDETQNISSNTFKSIVSRLGAGSKIIFLGDTGQVDMKKKGNSCLKTICEIFKDSDKVKVIEMDKTKEACIRNPDVSEILETLEKHNI